MTAAKWTILETDADLTLMSGVLGVSETLARVLANRGVRSKKAALSYLSPELSRLPDPFLMAGMEEAVQTIFDSISKKEKIVVYGDYDVDGITGTVILYKLLKRFGADASYMIPLRAEDGYGLNLNAVRELSDRGTNLIITVDNGIATLDEAKEAAALGMKLVVIDHHEPGYTETEQGKADALPAACAVVDPKRSDCAYPFKSMCAAGLAYRLSEAYHIRAGEEFSMQNEFSALAAFATVCDIAELKSDNRIIVKRGTDQMNLNKFVNPGLGSLIKRRGYLDRQIDAFAMGYILGPCVNATGRLENADMAVRLMLMEMDDMRGRDELAERLVLLNDERKELTAAGFLRAAQMVDSENPGKVIVLADRDAHESVAGIIAGRLKDKFNRPVVVLAPGEGEACAKAGPGANSYADADPGPEGGRLFKGSGRSVAAYNMFEALHRHRELFVRFGGHAMAAGLTMRERDVDTLRERLNAECELEERDFAPELFIDAALEIDEVTLELSNELSRLAPFGSGNREPLFVTYGMLAESCRVIEQKNTVIFTLCGKKGATYKGICFGKNELFEEQSKIAGKAPFLVDAVYAVETNEYNGYVSAQLNIRDFSLSPIA